MKLIVIVDQNWGIGNEGEQLLYLKPDLQRFKELTSGHDLILGRKTLATFPKGKPLPNRRNLILSRNQDLLIEGAEVFHDLETLVEYAPHDCFVIGGESVYRQLLPYCDVAYVTKVHQSYQADCYFPNLDQDALWWLEEESECQSYEGIDYTYCTYRKT